MLLTEKEATNEFLLEFHALAYLDIAGSIAWSVQWYELENTNRPLGNLVPDIVCVLPLEGADECHIWPPSRKPRATKKRTPHAAEAQFGLRSSGSQVTQFLDLEEDADEADDEEEPNEHTTHDTQLDAVEDDEYTPNQELLFLTEDIEFLKWEAQATGSCKKRPREQGETSIAEVEALVTKQAASSHVSPAPVAASATASSSTEVPSFAAVPVTQAALAVAPRAGTLRGLHGVADSVIYIAGSKISYYSNKGMFVADCKAHPHCNMTRTASAKKGKGTAICGGRPVGFLAMWLQCGLEVDCDSKAKHKDRDYVRAHCTLAKRREQREALQATVAGIDMLQYERGKEVDEQSEPEDLSGYI
eukprot:5590228-Amphidinium_carterae.2